MKIEYGGAAKITHARAPNALVVDEGFLDEACPEGGVHDTGHQVHTQDHRHRHVNEEVESPSIVLRAVHGKA